MTYVLRFTFYVSRLQTCHGWVRYLWAFHIFYALLFLSCQAEQGNYTAVNQEGIYVYGVWNARTAMDAKNFSRQMRQGVVSEGAHLQPLPMFTTAEPIELLPADGEASHWVRSREPSIYLEKELYKDTIGGNPNLYHAYGFIQQANVEYQTPRLGSKPLILVELFDMSSPENAFGLYSRNRYPQDEFEWVGNKAIISGDHLSFWKGRYFILIEGYEGGGEVKEGMIEVAKATAKQIKDPLTKPHLLTLLPPKEQVLNSDKYFPSNSTLKEVHPSLPEKVLKLSLNVTACSAAYLRKKSSTDLTDTMTAFILRYESESQAQAAYEAYRSDLQEKAIAVNSIRDGGVIAKVQEEIKK